MEVPAVPQWSYASSCLTVTESPGKWQATVSSSWQFGKQVTPVVCFAFMVLLDLVIEGVAPYKKIKLCEFKNTRTANGLKMKIKPREE